MPLLAPSPTSPTLAAPFDEFAGWLDAANLDVYDLFRFNCIHPSNFEAKLHFMTLAPLALSGALLGINAITACPSPQGVASWGSVR